MSGAGPLAGKRNTVRARTATRSHVRATAVRENVLNSLWFVPLCMAVGALALSVVGLVVDRHAQFDGFLVGAVASDARSVANVAATVAAAMLTFLGVVFSTTLVAVQLAGSQYSPRIVRVFVRSRLTQVTLGVFLSTFVYSMSTIVGVGAIGSNSNPEFTALLLYLLVLATVVTFVVFLHGMVKLLRVQYLLRITSRASHSVIDEAFPAVDAYSDLPAPPTGVAVRAIFNDPPATRRRGTPRVLQSVDVGGLAVAAGRSNCWVEMRVAVGDHVGPGVVLATVHGEDPSSLSDADVRRNLLFGTERTLLQDPGFGIRQLVDTACRALSPAINDPTTAVQALHRVVDLLSRVAGRPDPTGWYADESGVVRVRLVVTNFARLAELGFTEILRYGADAPQVARRLASAYEDLWELADEHQREVIAGLRTQHEAAIRATMPPAFVESSLRADRGGLG